MSDSLSGVKASVKVFLLVTVHHPSASEDIQYVPGHRVYNHKALTRIPPSCVPFINLLCWPQYVENGQCHQKLSTHEAQRRQVEEQEPLPEWPLEKGEIASGSHQEQFMISASRKDEDGVASWMSFLECEACGPV